MYNGGGNVALDKGVFILWLKSNYKHVCDHALK